MSPRRARLVLGVSAILACGEPSPPPEAEPSVERRPPASVAPPPGMVNAATATLPPVLAGVCVGGDPAEGIAWSIGGLEGEPLAREGIEQLASRDSARLVARIARMVDVLPSDSAVADFRGLPVAVRAAWLLVPDPGDTIVVARVARRMPLESSPLEELFAIIAAPGQRQGVREPLIEGWVAREVGAEETIAVRELVASIREPARIRLLFAHDAADGVHAELVVRTDGRWRTEWAGTLRACVPP